MSRRVASFNYQPLLRRAGILAAVSLGLAFALISFLFGFEDEFFSRLVGGFFVFFWLLAVTFLGVVPFVSWAAAHWFGKSWAAETVQPARKPRSAPAAATVRKPTRTVTGLNK
ncbi:hypothetical protein J0X19_04075 [Hymenobacter sp. BT186]|uniref:DUF2798 domain-containing protein n=1 Tax=Hymenobacter telluris TaxID=2816474 RepID=A0A939EWC6_9BACT|nr:hypothetical protein [Hymenobacter telluris]MBO0357113.1 hypothetical protein [Hymenobacter telluris]MBW3373140.1 hypothetical protein [Hymenobacter norwichensis]